MTVHSDKYRAIMERALGEAANVPGPVEDFNEGLHIMLGVLTRHIVAMEKGREVPLYRGTSDGRDVFTQAREAFDAYAGMDTPDWPATPQQALQVAMARWVNTKVKHTLPGFVENALGMGEELGEMAEAVLKLATAIGRVQHAVLKHSQGIRGFDDIDKLRRHVLDAGCDVSLFLMQEFTTMRCDYWTAVNATAQQVLERDWKARPLDAHAINEAGTSPDMEVVHDLQEQTAMTVGRP